MIQITPGELDIIIFDVEHGNCAFVQSPIGECLLLDCGSRDRFSPAKFIHANNWINQGIETVVVSHHDKDHITDYEKVVQYLNPKVYYNSLIPLTMIEANSDYNIGDCKHKYISHRKTLNPCGLHPYSGIEISYYQNLYKEPIDGPVDVNYHSVITFLEYGNTTFCFPGDITNDGLLELTKNESFLKKIVKTNIFLAPHHGRMSKAEKEDNQIFTIILKNMNPDIVIASDKSLDQVNENTVATDYYNRFSKGIIFDRGTDKETLRKILTTRQDNTIHIAVNETSFFIRTNAFKEDIDNFIKKE